MRWSKLKQLVEDRMADSLQRRVEVHTTWYRCLGHDRSSWITVDKHEVANMSDMTNRFITAHEIESRIERCDHYRDPGQRVDIDACVSIRAETILHQARHLRRCKFNRTLGDSFSLSVDDALASDNRH